MRPKLIVLVLACCWLLLALASTSAGAAQRIDMRVLLLGASGGEPTFQAWEAQLRREGVPYDTFIASRGHTALRAEALSRTEGGIEEARYQAVIVAVGNLPVCEATCVSALSAEEWAVLGEFERTFHVRQISQYVYPEPGFGTNWPSSGGAFEGVSARLTAEGERVFPYLRGPVSIGSGTWGYLATPYAAEFTTLVTDGGGSNALLGIYRHAEGREEMVGTFDGNQYQLQSQLLRHGELAWVTRGTYLGDQRTYLELQVDDVFLPDDIWDVEANRTDFAPEHAVRMSAEDATAAVEWSNGRRLRLDMVFNGGGSVEYREEHAGSDPLLSTLRERAATFGWINHTYEHPNLDCSTRVFIEDQIDRNTAWAGTAGFTVNSAELVTGEHSGLANLVPGNPGTIDPPWQDEPRVNASGGTLTAGRWEYGVTAVNENGETVPEIETVATSGSTSEVRLSWEAVCHATSYRIYRRSSPGGTWHLLEARSQPSPAFRDEGPVSVTFADRGGEGSVTSPPSANGARLEPYGQNVSFTEALEGSGVEYVATDSSKPYPETPTNVRSATYAAGSTWLDGRARAVPRYPTNVYYNVATRRQLLDEYNYLYLPPELGGACVLSLVTTCFTEAATWEQFVERESLLMFTHMMGNDPRPHYFHQTNLAQSRSAEGAVLYPVVDATVALYERYFSTAGAPIQQLTHAQIGDLLGKQSTWAGANARTVVGYIEREEVVVTNGERAAIEVPLTGTEVGSSYAGGRSGWDFAAEGTHRYRAATAWP